MFQAILSEWRLLEMQFHNTNSIAPGAGLSASRGKQINLSGPKTNPSAVHPNSIGGGKVGTAASKAGKPNLVSKPTSNPTRVMGNAPAKPAAKPTANGALSGLQRAPNSPTPQKQAPLRPVSTMGMHARGKTV